MQSSILPKIAYLNNPKEQREIVTPSNTSYVRSNLIVLQFQLGAILFPVCTVTVISYFKTSNIKKNNQIIPDFIAGEIANIHLISLIKFTPKMKFGTLQNWMPNGVH